MAVRNVAMLIQRLDSKSRCC